MGRKWTEADLRAAWSGFYVEREGCHEWSRARNADGYGYQRWGMKQLRAHRLAYELFVGPIPEGLMLRHRCDNPCCVNPDHLELGTAAENSQDMLDRGRSGGGRPYSVDPSLAEQFRECRAQGLTNQQIADRFGTNKSTVSRLIRGATRSRKDS